LGRWSKTKLKTVHSGFLLIVFCIVNGVSGFVGLTTPWEREKLKPNNNITVSDICVEEFLEKNTKYKDNVILSLIFCLSLPFGHDLSITFDLNGRNFGHIASAVWACLLMVGGMGGGGSLPSSAWI
jgi:hypothetical protein